MEVLEGEGGVEFGVFDVSAGEFEAIFDRVTENKATEDGGGGEGVGGEMGEHIDAIDRERFSDVLVRKGGIGKIDELGGSEPGRSKRLVKLRIISVIFGEDEVGTGEEFEKMGVIEILEIEDEFSTEGNIEIGGDFGDSSGVEVGGAVDIDIIVSFGRGDEGGEGMSRGGEVTDMTIGD